MTSKTCLDSLPPQTLERISELTAVQLVSLCSASIMVDHKYPFELGTAIDRCGAGRRSNANPSVGMSWDDEDGSELAVDSAAASLHGPFWEGPFFFFLFLFLLFSPPPLLQPEVRFPVNPVAKFPLAERRHERRHPGQAWSRRIY